MAAHQGQVVPIAVFASGNGSNLEAILQACVDGRLAARVAGVVCNKPGAGAIERASRFGVPVLVCDHREYGSREAHEEAILEWLRPLGVELVALAGYMRLVTPRLLSAFPGRVVNIHPADTRRHQGTGGYEWALREGLGFTVVTVHLVDEGMDTGRVVLQAPVAIEPGDSVETLARRGLAVEHEAYVRALDLLLAVPSGSRRDAGAPRRGEAGPLEMDLGGVANSLEADRRGEAGLSVPCVRAELDGLEGSPSPGGLGAPASRRPHDAELTPTPIGGGIG